MSPLERLARGATYGCAGLAAFTPWLAERTLWVPLLMGAALVLAWLLMESGRVPFAPPWISSGLAIPCAAYATLSMVAGETLMSAILSTLGLLLVAKVVRRKRPVDLMSIVVISLLMVLVGGLIAVNVFYFFVVAAHAVAMALALSVIPLLSADDRPVELLRAGGRVGASSVARLGIAISAGLVVAASLFFVLAPRDLQGLRDALGIRVAQESLAWSTGLMIPQRGRDIGMTGLESDIELGQIGRLILDPREAARVRVALDGRPTRLAPEDAYLAGVRLNIFDGRRWTTTTRRTGLWEDPSGVLTLPRAEQARRLVAQDVRITGDTSGLVLHLAPLHSVELPRLRRDSQMNLWLPPGTTTYRVQSRWRPLEGRTLTRSTQLTGAYVERPPTIHAERLRALAEEITAGAADDYARCRAIESWLSNRCEYTLDMDWETNADPVAEFLFVRRKGYCVYFASAMAVLLRSLPRPIPCQMVLGYAGGGWDATTQEHVFRRRDAHAWVEAWFPGGLIVPFDPTSTQRAANPPVEDTGPSWLAGVKLTLERVLLLYNSQRREEVLAGMARLARWTLMTWQGWTLTALAVAALLWRRRARRRTRHAGATRPRSSAQPAEPAIPYYRRCLRLLASRGLPRRPGQTPEELARVARLPGVADLTEFYLDERWAGRPASPSDIERAMAQLEGRTAT